MIDAISGGVKLRCTAELVVRVCKQVRCAVRLWDIAIVVKLWEIGDKFCNAERLLCAVTAPSEDSQNW